MKYFYGYAMTQFMGMEWGQHFITKAETLEEAMQKAEGEDWTHGDGVEELSYCDVQEIPEAHYDVLAQYVVVVA